MTPRDQFHRNGYILSRQGPRRLDGCTVQQLRRLYPALGPTGISARQSLMTFAADTGPTIRQLRHLSLILTAVVDLVRKCFFPQVYGCDTSPNRNLINHRATS